MIIPLRSWCLAVFGGFTVSLADLSPGHTILANPSAISRRIDSIAGEWKARGSDPGWNGRFVLRLILQQAGDSVFGTYQFEFDNVTAVPPADVFGHIRAGRLELQDRADRFWLSATLRRDHLDGRLAGGSRNRGSAISISLERVDRP